jgi:hypothetical protein
VNNAVARVAGLLAVAVLPLVAGLSGEGYADADQLVGPYRTAMSCCALLLLAGAVLSWVFVRERVQPSGHVCCPLNAPPLEDCSAPAPAAGARGR